VIFDHDSKFNEHVIAFLKATGLKPKRTSNSSALAKWNSRAVVGSCRRELLDHVIPLNEPHLRRLTGEYLRYHHGQLVYCQLR
jgi:putative transposase